MVRHNHPQLNVLPSVKRLLMKLSSPKPNAHLVHVTVSRLVLSYVSQPAGPAAM